MKLYQINVVCGSGSTGKIALDICREFVASGGSCRIAYGRGSAPEGIDCYKISNRFDLYYHALMTRLTDKHGLYSKRATKKLIADIRRYNPDIIHIHNVHGYYINYELLFSFLKEYGREVRWTLHDCWAFTGHCVHFSAVKCSQWKNGCQECCQLRTYPACYINQDVRVNYERKKKAFTDVPNLKIIVPSQWLADLVRQSFLREYPIEVVYNAVDKSIFKPTKSDFREVYQLEDKFVVLGVASVWSKRKGLRDFLKLAELLDEKSVIVLVGLNRRQIKQLTRGMIGIERTRDLVQLAGIYSAADVYVNLSVEETFGMTTAEALACGTPAIVYEDTACEEVARMLGGTVVPQDVRAVHAAILLLRNSVQLETEKREQ